MVVTNEEVIKHLTRQDEESAHLNETVARLARLLEESVADRAQLNTRMATTEGRMTELQGAITPMREYVQAQVKADKTRAAAEVERARRVRELRGWVLGNNAASWLSLLLAILIALGLLGGR